MSKKLSLNQQITYIEGHLKKRGIEPDTIDVEALVDPELSYRENLQNVLEQSGVKKGKVQSEEQEILKEATVCDTVKRIKSKIKEIQEKDSTLQELRANLKDAQTLCRCNECKLMGLETNSSKSDIERFLDEFFDDPDW